jgi:prevent-host-death family protein
MKRIGVETLQGNTLRFVNRVRRTGEPVIITRDGDEVARLVPPKRRFWQRIWEFFGFARRKGTPSTRASWGVYLKMR